MEIEVRGRELLLEELRLHLQDQLERYGFTEGPKISSMDRGLLIDYTKKGVIVSIQVTQESESGESRLYVSSEVEIPELNEIWDTALISYGKELMFRLQGFAVDKKKVAAEISSVLKG